jgi:hypothetical protein
LKSAFEGKEERIQKLLRDEEDRERKLDREYWEPLKKELSAWRREK